MVYVGAPEKCPEPRFRPILCECVGSLFADQTWNTLERRVENHRPRRLAQASQTVDAIAPLDSRKAVPVSSDIPEEQSSEDTDEAPASTEIEQLKKATA